MPTEFGDHWRHTLLAQIHMRSIIKRAEAHKTMISFTTKHDDLVVMPFLKYKYFWCKLFTKHARLIIEYKNNGPCRQGKKIISRRASPYNLVIAYERNDRIPSTFTVPSLTWAMLAVFFIGAAAEFVLLEHGLLSISGGDSSINSDVDDRDEINDTSYNY